MRLVSIFARSGTLAYPDALARYRKLIRARMPAASHRIILADNELPQEYEERLPENTLLTGAPGKNREFDSWSHAIARYGDILQEADLAILVTSAFENKPDAWLKDLNPAVLQFARAHNLACGHMDSQEGDLRIADKPCGDWLRTSLVVLPPAALLSLGYLPWPGDAEQIFSGDPQKPFLADCPISPDLQEAILAWLCGRFTRYKNRWHGCFELTKAKMPLFISKSMAIINEKWLSCRLGGAGLPLADISWLSRALDNGLSACEIPAPRIQTLANSGVFTDNKNSSARGSKKPRRLSEPWGAPLPGGPLPQAAAIKAPAALFIDKRMLTPDTDSGSFSNFSLVRAYAELGFEVDFLPNDLVILDDYLELHKQAGIRCLGGETGSINEYLRKEGAKYSLIFLCRQDVAAEHYEAARKYAPDAKIVFYTVDLHFLRLNREAAVTGDAQTLARARERKAIELELVRNCDAAIVLSEYEKAVLEDAGLGDKTRHIPILVFDVAQSAPGWKERGDVMFIGGFSHRPNVDAAIWFCRRILPLARKKIPSLRVHIIGSNMPAQVRDLAGLPGVIPHGFMEDVAPAFNSCRLSVAPLRYGAGLKGKIGQSLAYGLPVVSTAMGAEGMPQGEGTGVLIAKDEQDFADKLAELYRDEEKWSRESLGALKSACENYSTELNRLRQLRLLASLGLSLPPCPAWPLRSRREFLNLASLLANEPHLMESPAGPRSCLACQTPLAAVAAESGQSGDICPKCGMGGDARLLVHYFYTRIRPGKEQTVYLTESSTAPHAFLRARLPLLAAAWPQGLSFYEARPEPAVKAWPGSFDCALAVNTPALVPDVATFFRKISASLKPGGIFLFTAPFRPGRTEAIRRAQANEEGEITHYLPPRLAGGALVFREFGWNILALLRACGFVKAWAELCQPRITGGALGGSFIFSARKG